jgi:CRISPR-associated protein Cas2
MSPTILAVLVYDVSDDGRRAKLHALLKEYGVPVQKSAFEARLTPREREQLVRRAARIVDPATDRFVLYGVTREQETRILALGQPRPTLQAPRYYIV